VGVIYAIIKACAMNERISHSRTQVILIKKQLSPVRINKIETNDLLVIESTYFTETIRITEKNIKTNAKIFVNEESEVKSGQDPVNVDL
jgi:hypothetical protein